MNLGEPYETGSTPLQHLPFLHLDCLPPSPTKGSLPIKTIGEACRQQAQALMHAVIFYAHERLQLGQRAQDVFDYLFAKQQPVMAR